MLGSAFDKNEYLRVAEDRFKEFGGKLFLVDYSAADAILVLKKLIGKETESFLMITDDPASARELEPLLKQTLGDICVIDSYNAFCEAIEVSSPDSMRSITNAVRSLKSRKKNLIVTARDEKGEPVLNRALCKNMGVGGTYGNGSASDYCISDALAECGYEFAAVNNVYSVFTLISGDKDDDEERKPGDYDLLTFHSNSYYSPGDASYKRLKALLSASPKRLVISDLLAKESIAELYAVMDMLYSTLSLAEARGSVRKISSDYDEDCHRIYNDISYNVGDENITSSCLYRANDLPCKTPADVYSMTEFIRTSIDFMSEEEIFLSVMESVVRRVYGGRYPSVESVSEYLEQNMDNIADVFCDVFFGSRIKGELESVTSTPITREMKREEMAAVFEVFNKYGVYHALSGLESEKLDILRNRRDCSGFEYFVRRRSPYLKTDGAYSIIKPGSDLYYGCVQVERLALTSEPFAPALVIVNDENVSAVTGMLTCMLEGYSVTDKPAELLSSASEKTVAVIGATAAMKSPSPYNLASAIIIDPTYNTVRLKLLINKLFGLCSGKVSLVCHYGDMSGHVIDKWESVLLAKDEAVCFDALSIILKEGFEFTYETVMGELESFYTMLARVVRDGHFDMKSEFTERYNLLLRNYTYEISKDEKYINPDIEFLGRLGRYFDRVFINTASVGDNGEVKRTVAIDYETPDDGKTINEITLEAEERVLLFNACAKMLRHECDQKEHGCADCGNYENFAQNSFEELKASVATFFERAIGYLKLKQDETKDISDSVFHNDDSEEKAYSFDEILELKVKAEECIKAIELASADFPALFEADHAVVAELRTAVYNTYKDTLRKYYGALRDIFYRATDRAIEIYSHMSVIGNTVAENQ